VNKGDRIRRRFRFVRFQDVETMRTPCQRAVAALLLVPLLARAAVAEEAATSSSDSPFRSALSVTQTRGVPLVVIVTAQDQPAAVQLWNEFRDGGWMRAHRGLILAVQVSREREPQLVRLWTITRFPTVLVFGRDRQGAASTSSSVVLLGSTSDCGSASALAAWLDALDSGQRSPAPAQAPAMLDASVRHALLGADAYPSLQQQPSPPPSPAPSPPAAPAMPVAPTYAPPMATTSAGVIQVPSQNLVVQQAPPQIFMAPAQAPIVYVPQQPVAAPMMPVAPPPAANMFLPVSGPMADAAPVVAAAPAVALAPAAPAPVAAPVVAYPAAVTNQTLALPASPTATRVRVRGPGLLGASLAHLGERLVQFGRARIVTTQVTTLEPPYPQVGSGLTTISTTSAAPIAPPPTSVAAPLAPPFTPPQESPQPQPSPQGGPPRKHFLFPDHQ